jgi:hypothetical protein
MDKGVAVSAVISMDEWDQGIRGIGLLSNDPNSPQSSVCLVADGETRGWVIGHAKNTLIITTEPDERSFRCLLSPDAFWAGVRIAQSDGFCTVALLNNGDLRLAGNSRTFEFTNDHDEYPLEQFEHHPDIDDTTFTVTRDDVLESLYSMVSTKANDEGEHTIRLFRNTGSLSLINEVSAGGRLEAEIPISNARGETDMLAIVSPVAMIHVLQAFRSGDELTMTIRMNPLRPVLISCSGMFANVQTYKPREFKAYDRAKAVIKQVCGSLATVPDSDGDFPLVRRHHSIFGRFVFEKGDVTFQVFSVILENVNPSEELLKEINDLNTNVQFGRIFWVENQVLVEVDLVAGTLDVDELVVALERITQVSDNIAPMLATVFGGELHAAPLTRRRLYYKNTVVHANVTPTSSVELNGPNAVEEWPFSGNVHVITGWNPQGVERDGDEVNAQIAADVLRQGGSFVLGRGSSLDGSYSEPSLIIWGLNREDALTIGSHALQDAIFEISPETITVIDCETGHAESASRLALSS